MTRFSSLVAAAVLLAALPAVAGQRFPVLPTTVTINTQYHYLSGIVSHARNSAATSERISCSITGTAFGRSAMCSVTDANNQQIFCYTSEPNIIDAISYLQSESYIYISWDPTTGRCSTVSTYVDSAYMPKAP